MNRNHQHYWQGIWKRKDLTKISWKVLSWLFFFLAFQCNRTIGSGHQVPKQVDSLINVFKLEALKRGVLVNTSSEELKVVFGDLGTRTGSCKPNARPKIITLDGLAWKLVPNHTKEMLLFHELAHCFIGRLHDNARLPTGECKSWMRESDKVCVINVVNARWRDYYLDELFSKAKNVPLWYDGSHRPSEEQELLSTATLRSNRFEILDTMLSRQGKHWKLNLDLPSIGRPGYISLKINEYSLEFSYTNGSPNYPAVRSEAIMLYQFKTAKFNIFSTEVIRKMGARRRVVVEKRNAAIFVFFDEEMRLCIPIQNEMLRIEAFSSFPDNELKIEVFKMKGI